MGTDNGGGEGRTLTVVYVDTLFLLNLILDYLLLRLSARICGQYIPLWRLGLGALLGGVYAVCAFLPAMGFLARPESKLAAGVGMALAAFGGRRRLLRLTGVFFACACALGGGMLLLRLLGERGWTFRSGIPATGPDLKGLLLSAAGIYLLISLSARCLGRYSRLRREIVPVTLLLEGRLARLDAMVDTGNTLSDPFSGARVMVAEWEAVRPLLAGEGKRVEEVLTEPAACVQVLGALLGPGRTRLVPYRAVGVEAGMLPALRVDRALIGGARAERLLVALCPGKLAADGAYTALIGAEQ